jgi:hypothetical protein
MRVGTYKGRVLEDETRTKAQGFAELQKNDMMGRDIAKSAHLTTTVCWCDILVSCKMHYHHLVWNIDNERAIFAMASITCCSLRTCQTGCKGR